MIFDTVVKILGHTNPLRAQCPAQRPGPARPGQEALDEVR